MPLVTTRLPFEIDANVFPCLGEPEGCRRLMAESPVVYTGLHAGLGPEADQEISQWEEMFLPEKVRERVLELQVMGEDGTPTPLVRSERVLYEAVGRAPDRQQPPTWTLNFLVLGLLLAAVMVGLARAARRSAAGRFAFAAVGSLWTLLVGVGGLLLAGLWTLTNHTAAHRNENLFHFDPLAIALVAALLPVAAPAGLLPTASAAEIRFLMTTSCELSGRQGATDRSTGRSPDLRSPAPSAASAWEATATRPL